MLIRTGFLCLRRIADFYVDPVRRPTRARTTRSRSPARSSTRCGGQLADAGVPMKPDRDQAWRDYAGWRVNYDTVLTTLASMVDAPYAMWSSDRAPGHGATARRCAAAVR